MKRGILTAVIILVVVAAVAILYWQSQPKLDEARIKECETTPDKSACIREEKQLLKCEQNIAPGEEGIADLQKCFEAVTGPREELIPCSEQPELPECKAISECSNSTNTEECLKQAEIGKVSVVFETSS